MQRFVKIHPDDNVLVALEDLPSGSRIDFEGARIELLHDISQKHKFTIHELGKDEVVLMYGVPVGKTNEKLAAGMPLTTQNLRHFTSESIDTKTRKAQWNVPDISDYKNKTFMGYHRANGEVGTRNNWLVIPLVFCENRNIDAIRDHLAKKLGYDTKSSFDLDIDKLIDRYNSGADADTLIREDILVDRETVIEKRIFRNVDGIKFLKHEGGCGGIRQDSETLCNLLAGYVKNPNVAGATFLSLGCQNAQIEMMKNALDKAGVMEDKIIYFLEQQAYNTEKELISAAVKYTFAGLSQANEIERKPAPLSKLTLGLECGGSDGFSGISANPVLGYASDMLVALGGTAILSEFPELNGVEQELASRCIDEEKAMRFIHLMEAYHQKAIDAGSGFSANPSPGNIKDGLITDAMKSAGAAKKGGTSPVVAVLDYTEEATKGGLNLLCTPGNDVESTTGLAGSGANLIVFTTGLGTPTGNPVAPVIKMSSNSKLYQRMNDIIDFDSGGVISGSETIESAGIKLFELLIKVASGEEQTKADLLGQDDFIPWKRGVSL